MPAKARYDQLWTEEKALIKGTVSDE